jgi:lipopolysaccharide heptosyltransferase II
MRLLVVKLSSLGDLFHPLPAVHSLKEGLNASVDWAVQSEYAEMVEAFTDVSAVIPVSRRRFVPCLGALKKRLADGHYDMAIDMQGLLKSGAVTWLSGAPRRIGPSFHREGSRVFFTEVTGRRNKHRHAVEENLDVVRHLELPFRGYEFPVRFPAVELDGPQPRIAMLPLSRWPSKNWPTPCFAEVGRRLRKTFGATLYILGGSRDADVCNQLRDDIGDGALSLAGKCSLTETGSVLAAMDLLISNDSGPVHMAAAIGTPCLVVFGPTDPARTGPFGPDHRIVRTQVCGPCFSRSCRKPGIPCLASVTPERVTEEACAMLRARELGK